LMRTGKCDHHIFKTYSDDGGKNWSQPEKLPFMGVDPDLIEMEDGALAYPSGGEPLLHISMADMTGITAIILFSALIQAKHGQIQR